MWRLLAVVVVVAGSADCCSSVRHPLLPPTLFVFSDSRPGQLCADFVSDDSCSLINVNLRGLFSRKLLISAAVPPTLSNSIEQEHENILLEKETEEGTEHILKDGSVSTLTYRSSYGPVVLIVKDKQVHGSLYWKGDRYSIQPCPGDQTTESTDNCHLWIKKKKKSRFPAAIKPLGTNSL